MEYADGIRVSDAERERVVNDLTRHLTSGRLDINEFDLRVGEVYRATTREELRRVLGDLPAVADLPVAPTPAPRTRRRRLPVHQQIEWLAWAAAGMLNLVIWGIISVATASMIYFWPIWVIGPWGLVLLGRTMLGRTGLGVPLTGNRLHGSSCGARLHC